MMAQRQILMCPPDYFDIAYSINPWMNTHHGATGEKTAQWQGLKKTFETLGAKIEQLTPQPGLPDMVYIDAGVLWGDTFIPSNFRYPERQGERPHFTAWFASHGYTIVDVPSKHFFEGHGDTLWAEKTLFCGHGFRSCLEAHAVIGRILQAKDAAMDIVSIELVDPRFYHLDTCFCPLGDGRALVFDSAIDAPSRRVLADRLELISVPEEEAVHFACNAVVLGSDVVLPENAPKTTRALEALGYTVHALPMSEFIKGGGACKCLSFFL